MCVNSTSDQWNREMPTNTDGVAQASEGCTKTSGVPSASKVCTNPSGTAQALEGCNKLSGVAKVPVSRIVLYKLRTRLQLLRTERKPPDTTYTGRNRKYKKSEAVKEEVFEKH